MSADRQTQRALSDTLLEFAQPLITLMGGGRHERDLHAALRLSMALWNAGVLERSGKGPGTVEHFLVSLERRGAPKPVLDLLTRQARKQREHPEFDPRIMLDFELYQGSEGEPRLRVTGASIEEVDVAELLGAFGLVAEQAGASTPSRDAEAGTRRKRNPTRETGAKRAPASGAEPWRSLFEQAKRLHALAPWDWLLDRDVFGVRIAGDPRIHWCSVMGAGGTYFGIGVYRGDAAFGALRSIARGEDPDAGMRGFDGYLFSFVDREEISAQERSRIKAAGVNFRGRAAWPQLEEVTAGRLPRPFDAERGPTALALLEIISAGAEAMRARVGGEPQDLEGELPVFEFSGSVLALSTARPEPVPDAPLPPVDLVTVARLAATSTRRDVTIEFDARGVPMRVPDDQGWEYAPTAFLAGEAHFGAVLSPRLEPPERARETCAYHALAMFADANLLPARLHVSRPWVFDALAPTAAALGIELTLRDRIPSVERLHADLARFTTR